MIISMHVLKFTEMYAKEVNFPICNFLNTNYKNNPPCIDASLKIIQ